MWLNVNGVLNAYGTFKNCCSEIWQFSHSWLWSIYNKYFPFSITFGQTCSKLKRRYFNCINAYSDYFSNITSTDSEIQTLEPLPFHVQKCVMQLIISYRFLLLISGTIFRKKLQKLHFFQQPYFENEISYGRILFQRPVSLNSLKLDMGHDTQSGR